MSVSMVVKQYSILVFCQSAGWLSLTLSLCFLQADTATPGCDVYYDDIYRGLAANCMYRSLRFVPRNLPTSIVMLQLGNNKLKSLPAKVFQSYGDLKELDLSENDISGLEVESFNGLAQLLSLKLWRNRLSMDSASFPVGVFKPLTTLQYLFLNKSKIKSEEGDFPDEVFKDLIYLKELYIDTWPGPKHRTGLKGLKSLESLSIMGIDCHLTQINNNTFAVLDKMPVIFLNIACLLNTIETGALMPFQRLKFLKIESSYDSIVSLSKATVLLKPFVNTDMKEIYLSRLQTIRDATFIESNLNKKTMSYLLDVCVEQVDLSYNRITTVSSDIIDDDGVFVKCVKYIDLSHNYISSQAAVLLKMYTFRNLETFDMSNNYGKCPDITRERESLEMGFGRLSLFCPPRLQNLDIHFLGHNQEVLKRNVTFHNCSQLYKLDISEIGNFRFSSYVSGLNTLRYLDISDNTVDESFFSHSDLVDNLESLTAKNTKLNFDFMNSRAFFHMKKLRSLDLSLTGLYTVKTGSFRQFHSMKYLILSGNKFDNIPNELTEIDSLAYLDMSNNVLRAISSDTRSRLDNRNKENRSFELHLQGNLFLCSCETLDFIVWLRETAVNLDLGRNYSCIRDDGTMSDTKWFYKNYLHQWRKCVGQTWLFLSVIWTFLVLMTLTVIFLIEKYLPKLEYYFLMLLGYEPEEPPRRKDSEYDCYLCYDEARYVWPVHCLYKKLRQLDRNVRLYLPDLHEEVGGIKAESITEALSNSWKVVIIICEESFTDEWFYFTVLSAVRLLSNSTMTSRIVLLYKDDTPQVRARTPQFLVNVVRACNILRVRDDEDFWQEVHRLIMEDHGPDALF